jgi:hypothetical protein
VLLLSPEPLPLLSVVYPMSVTTAFGVGCFGVLLLLLLLLQPYQRDAWLTWTQLLVRKTRARSRATGQSEGCCSAANSTEGTRRVAGGRCGREVAIWEVSPVCRGVQPRTSDVASGYVRGGCVVAQGCLMLVSPRRTRGRR